MDALKNRCLTAFVVLLTLYSAQESRGISAYLKQTGPAPLRFSIENPVPPSFTLPEILAERQTHTNAPESVATTATSVNTNTVSVDPVPIPTPSHQPTVITTESPANAAPTPSASDMLPISPQMLTEYFKPVADGTNADSNAAVPVAPVRFTPPVAKPSSRATYSTP